MNGVAWLSLFLLVTVISGDSTVKDVPEVEVEDLDSGEFDPSIDTYPEHEPIMQPFDETYEEEQAFEEQRLKRKTEKKSSSESDTTKAKIVVNQFEGTHDEEDLLKEPQMQYDGMADHEPIYQPEDPGELPYIEPEETAQDANVNTKRKGSLTNDRHNHQETVTTVANEHHESNGFDLDDHEPIYQPEDPGEPGEKMEEPITSHEEL